ncbi:MAG: hypothetical protein WBO17_04305 [Sphingorhabdus sp.]
MIENGSTPPRLAGGIFIALGLLVGAIGGVVLDQPSAGMVAGMAAGAVIAVLVWLFDRRRG